MPWHHVIPKHEWKRRFGNLRGVNALDNQVNLSLENHTQIHQRYGEEGSKYDRIAGLRMSRQIGCEEAQKRAVSVANTGNKHSLGTKHTAQWKQDQSLRKRGVKLGQQPQMTCPHCNTNGGAYLMRRWHFDNCKRR